MDKHTLYAWKPYLIKRNINMMMPSNEILPKQFFLLFYNAKSSFLSIEPQMYYCPKFSSCDHPFHRCTKIYCFFDIQ